MTGNPEIKNTPFKFYPIFGNWGELGIPNLARMSLIIYYWMLQNDRVTQGNSFYCFWVTKGKPTGGVEGGKITPALCQPPRLGLLESFLISTISSWCIYWWIRFPDILVMVVNYYFHAFGAAIGDFYTVSGEDLVDVLTLRKMLIK